MHLVETFGAGRSIGVKMWTSGCLWAQIMLLRKRAQEERDSNELLANSHLLAASWKRNTTPFRHDWLHLKKAGEEKDMNTVRERGGRRGGGEWGGGFYLANAFCPVQCSSVVGPSLCLHRGLASLSIRLYFLLPARGRDPRCCGYPGLHLVGVQGRAAYLTLLILQNCPIKDIVPLQTCTTGFCENQIVGFLWLLWLQV